jgi:murein DD-endopeptidase MepM/ murein hydrolase activator NlpD
MDPYRTLRLLPSGKRMAGPDVEAFQHALNRQLAQYAGLHEGEDTLNVDGRYGPATRAAYRWVGWYATGFVKARLNRGVDVDTQMRLIRAPGGLTENQRKRAAARRARLASGDGVRPAAPGYPLAVRGEVIGWPGQGTHSWEVAPNNWQSDNAVDIAARVGTAVFAVIPGRIGTRFGELDSDNPRMKGIRLYVEAPSNEWYYQHLSATAAGIAPGVAVTRGQLLGYSGSANGSPHLHIACKKGDPTTLVRK